MQPYNTDMSKAPLVGELTLCVPTGRVEDPLALESGHWDVALKRWEGDWRYDPEGYADAEPIGWATVAEPQPAIFVAAKAIAQSKVEAAARKLKCAITGPKPKPADPRPAKGKHGVDMTTGKPVPGARVKPIKVDTKDKETFDAL